MEHSIARVILDVDTGIDDALALIFATAEPRLEVVGVSTVVGNVPAELAAGNSAAVLSAVGHSSVPVVVGARVTTAGRGPRVGPTNHGRDGLGGVLVRPASPPPAAHDGAVALLDALAAQAPVTVAACAPLTNVARYAPRPGVAHVVLVGGEVEPEEDPEFNIGHDPAAAAAVLATDVPVTVFPIEVFETVRVPPSTVGRLRGSPQPAARLAGDLLAVRRDHLLGDAASLVLLAHPGLATVQRRRMGVVGSRLLVDAEEGREVGVVVAADAAAVIEAFVSAVTRQPARHMPDAACEPRSP